MICKAARAGRVGNMIVLLQRTETVVHISSGEGGATRTYQRPRLLIVLGPYWMILFGVTVPAFSLLSFWTASTSLHDQSIAVTILWTIATAGLFGSLLSTGCRDPGLLYRHHEQPDDNWRWSDQGYTYRPPDAKYDKHCGVIIEGYDHICPWTGE